MSSNILIDYIYITTLIGLALILAVVALKDFRSKLYQSFLLYGGLIYLYVAAAFIPQASSNHSVGLFWSRFALLLANFIPLSFYLFTRLFTGDKVKRQLLSWFVCLTPFLLAIVAFSHYTITKIAYTTAGITLTGTGPGLWLTLLYFAVVFSFCFWLFHKQLRASPQSVKSQIKLITYGTAVVVIVNLLTQIVLPEVHLTALGNTVGNTSLLLYVGAVGYAILRQRLFDIRSSVLRTLVFVVTLSLTVIVFTIALLAPVKLLFKGPSLSGGAEVYVILASVLLAIAFQRLTGLFRKITDRLFFQDRYDPAALIGKVNQVLASEIDLDTVCQKVRVILAHTMHVKDINILVLDRDQIFYEAINYTHSVYDNVAQDLSSLGDKLLLTDELYDNDKKVVLQKYGICAFEVLQTGEEKVGYLLCSEKLNGTSYNATDFGVIDAVSDALAVAIQNSRAYVQIQKFNASLENRVEDATRQLRGANEKLTQQDNVKNDFITMISHQLGTPLTVIDGFLTLAIQGLYGNIEDSLKETLGKALSRTRMLERLTFDLLNISRMTAGRFFLELTQADIAKIVADEVDLLQAQAKDKRVALVYHPPARPIPLLTIDEPKTRQAVMNLINNAIFYAPGGNVDVYLDSDEQNIIFKVVDNGIGVPDNQKTLLFTKFFRADNARKESPNGTGIGLYLTNRIVTDQKGKIIFHSVDGKGSTFGFTLPLTSTEAKSPAPPVAAVSTKQPALSEKV